MFAHAAAVSKAFSCLSDASKRAAYDRYGEEQQPGLSRTRSTPFGGQDFDDFDPNEIFNMFFGRGFGTPFPGGRWTPLLLPLPMRIRSRSWLAL